jgi:hypothetical protein
MLAIRAVLEIELMMRAFRWDCMKKYTKNSKEMRA